MPKSRIDKIRHRNLEMIENLQKRLSVLIECHDYKDVKSLTVSVNNLIKVNFFFKAQKIQVKEEVEEDSSEN